MPWCLPAFPQRRTNTSGVNFTSSTSFRMASMSASYGAWCGAAWLDAEAERRALRGGRPGDRERDLDRLARRLEGELDVEPLFLCRKDARGCARGRHRVSTGGRGAAARAGRPGDFSLLDGPCCGGWSCVTASGSLP